LGKKHKWTWESKNPITLTPRASTDSPGQRKETTVLMEGKITATRRAKRLGSPSKRCAGGGRQLTEGPPRMIRLKNMGGGYRGNWEGVKQPLMEKRIVKRKIYGT